MLLNEFGERQRVDVRTILGRYMMVTVSDPATLGSLRETRLKFDMQAVRDIEA